LALYNIIKIIWINLFVFYPNLSILFHMLSYVSLNVYHKSLYPWVYWIYRPVWTSAKVT